MKERGRLRLVCSSWARAVDEMWQHKLQLNMADLALDDLDDEKQQSLAAYLSKNCKRVKELVVSYDEEPFGCSTSPDFWLGLRPLASRLTTLFVQNVSIRATRRFFMDFLCHCSNLESLTYRPICAYGCTDFDDEERNGDIVLAFSTLTKLKHLRLTIDYYQSDGGRFLALFAAAKALETFDVRHFKLSYYRTFSSTHVAAAVAGRAGILHTFRTSSYLNADLLRALIPSSCYEPRLRELEFILEGRSLTYDEHFDLVKTCFERLTHLQVLRVRTSGCLFVDVGAPFDPKILFTILNACPPGLHTFHFDHVHALMRKRTDRYASEFALTLERFAPTLRELRLNVARVAELSAIAWSKFGALRSLSLDDCHLIDYAFLQSLTALQKLILKPTAVTRSFLRELSTNLPPQLEELTLSCRDYVGEDGYERRPMKDDWSQVFCSSRALRLVVLVQVDAAVTRHNYVKYLVEWAKKAFPKIRFTYRTQNGALLDRHL